MRAHQVVLFIFFTVLFLFYAGNEQYYQIFAYHRDLFKELPQRATPIAKDPIPVVANHSSPQVSAEGAYIVDLTSFTPIFAKNEHERLFPASTTKIITALVVMDVFKPEDIITVKQVHNEGQVMGLQAGEQITVNNLLYGLLVYSGNDAAYAFADAYGYDKFIALMNEKARALHMNDSHFINPAGLDADGQLTSPFDLALAGRELLSHTLLKNIVSTKEITISDVDFKIFHQLENVNKLLGEIQGIGGLKTGETDAAGQNLVSFYKKNGHQFLIVVLKSTDRFADTRTIVNWIDTNVSFIPIAGK